MPTFRRPAGIEIVTIDASPPAPPSDKGNPIAMSTGLLARVALMLADAAERLIDCKAYLAGLGLR
jgi:hypothetical protein